MDIEKNTEPMPAKDINEQIREALKEAQQAYISKPTEAIATKDKNETTVPYPANDNEEPAWFKKYREEQEHLYQQLRADNETMKAAKQREERDAMVVATAQRVGIPKYLLDHLNIDPEADIEQQLIHIKQELVNHSLLSADTQREQDSTHTLIENDADEWAIAL